MSINKILLEHSHTQFSAYGSFHSAAAAELRLTKPKILTEQNIYSQQTFANFCVSFGEGRGGVVTLLGVRLPLHGNSPFRSFQNPKLPCPLFLPSFSLPTANRLKIFPSRKYRFKPLSWNPYCCFLRCFFQCRQFEIYEQVTLQEFA